MHITILELQINCIHRGTDLGDNEQSTDVIKGMQYNEHSLSYEVIRIIFHF